MQQIHILEKRYFILRVQIETKNYNKRVIEGFYKLFFIGSDTKTLDFKSSDMAKIYSWKFANIHGEVFQPKLMFWIIDDVMLA